MEGDFGQDVAQCEGEEKDVWGKLCLLFELLPLSQTLRPLETKAMEDGGTQNVLLERSPSSKPTNLMLMWQEGRTPSCLNLQAITMFHMNIELKATPLCSARNAIADNELLREEE